MDDVARVSSQGLELSSAPSILAVSLPPPPARSGRAFLNAAWNAGDRRSGPSASQGLRRLAEASQEGESHAAGIAILPGVTHYTMMTETKLAAVTLKFLEGQ